MRKILLLFTFCLAAVPLTAQPAFPFLRTDRNPVSSAMGGTEIASALFNPAAVPFAEESDIMLSYQGWAPTTLPSSHFNLLGGFKFGEKMGLTAVGGFEQGKPYTLIDEKGGIGKEFTPTAMVAGLGFGYRITDALTLGVQARMAAETLTEKDSYTGFAADVCLGYAMGDVRLYGGAASLGPQVKGQNASYGLPASGVLGASYDKALATGRIHAAVQADAYFTGGLGLGLGAEYGYNRMIFLRGGYHLGTEGAPIPSYLSFGAGFRYAGVHLDLSYLTASQTLGNTVTLGLGFAF